MTPQMSMTTRSWAETASLGLIWGGSFLAVGLVVGEVGVATTVALRVGGACAILWAYVLWQRLDVPVGASIWGAFLVIGLLYNVIPFTLIAWGQLTIQSGLAAILNATTSIFGVLVASAAFTDERLTPAKGLGVAVGFAGVVVVIGPTAILGLDVTSLAQLAVLGASLSYALAGAFARVAISGLDPEVAAAGMLTGSTAVMVPAALVLDGLPTKAWSATAWGGLAYLAAFASALAYLIFYRILRRAGAGNASLVTLLVAPVAILLGALVLGESLPARAYVGFALVALGLVVLDGRVVARAWEALA